MSVTGGHPGVEMQTGPQEAGTGEKECHPSTAHEPVVRFHLDRALELVAHDRWVLGGLRDGKLRVLVDSSPEPDRPFRRTRPLSHLARRCLHEGKPAAVWSRRGH
jgi:hypothetical protein